MKKAIFIGVAALTLLALACNEPPVAVEEDYRIIPTSPVKVLKNVEIAFNRGDVNLLKGMLSENFVFYFDPDDVGTNPPGVPNYRIPESWTYTDFWQAVSRMFTNAYSISLTIPTAGVGEPAPSEETYKAENISIKLLVMVDEVNGFIADTGYCDYQFERYDGEEGRKFWRLTKWWDWTAMQSDGYPGLAPASFGRVLALYY